MEIDMENKTFQIGGHDYIVSKINEAIANESRTAIISGSWEIDEVVRIPSNFTLILENCHLRLKDGSATNIFVNEHHNTDLGRTVEGTDRNISIIGRGEAILDGGKFNDLPEKKYTSTKEMSWGSDELPPLWKNNLIIFSNVDGFKVSGLYCCYQRWWALHFAFCRNGYIGNIEFRANDLAIDKNGNEYHGLIRERHKEVFVKNADGVDIRCGCHDILIENITGFAEDDIVALTAVPADLAGPFAVKGLPSDICRMEIRNIKASAFHSIVRLLNQGGVKLHDILVDTVYDTSKTCPYLNHGANAVKIGDLRMYGGTHSKPEDTYNISLRNIIGGSEHVLSLNGSITNLTMYGIEAMEGTKMIYDTREIKN